MLIIGKFIVFLIVKMFFLVFVWILIVLFLYVVNVIFDIIKDECNGLFGSVW